MSAQTQHEISGGQRAEEIQNEPGQSSRSYGRQVDPRPDIAGSGTRILTLFGHQIVVPDRREVGECLHEGNTQGTRQAGEGSHAGITAEGPHAPGMGLLQLVRQMIAREVEAVNLEEQEDVAHNNYVPLIPVPMEEVNDETVEEMDVNEDNLSFEELQEVQERIGNVSTGWSKEAIYFLLRHRRYASAMKSSSEEDDSCTICLDEYRRWQHLGWLECGHYFHRRCITEWLTRRNTCPVCRREAF